MMRYSYIDTWLIYTLWYWFSKDFNAQSDFGKIYVTRKLVPWSHFYLKRAGVCLRLIYFPRIKENNFLEHVKPCHQNALKKLDLKKGVKTITHFQHPQILFFFFTGKAQWAKPVGLLLVIKILCKINYVYGCWGGPT